MRISSKLCGPLTWPKMFINSFMHDPFRGNFQPSGDQRRTGTTACLARYPPVKSRSSVIALLQLDIEAQRAQLLDQHVEALGDAGLEIVVAPDDRLVDLGAA